MQQGMQQGIQRGTQRGISFTAKNMLDKAFSLDAISSITGLSQAVLKKMQRKGEY
jgi:predicted transposase/invertase (TIGR01784 family)